jgi:hypothetical protein
MSDKGTAIDTNLPERFRISARNRCYIGCFKDSLTNCLLIITRWSQIHRSIMFIHTSEFTYEKTHIQTLSLHDEIKFVQVL